MTHEHPNHKKELARINRISGQIDGIKKMILDKRECFDIVMQLKAVRCAILSVEKSILSTHLEKCIAESFEDKISTKEKIQQIKELFEKLQN